MLSLSGRLALSWFTYILMAYSHPLGATGGRLAASLIHELRRTGKEVGVATLCIGTGASTPVLLYR